MYWAQGQPIPTLLKLRGEALFALGQADEAIQALEEARRGAQEQGARPLLWQIHRSLGRVYAAFRQKQLAHRELAAAREVIEGLAASLADTEQRERFLSVALASFSFKHSPDFAPGKGGHYTNTSYILLGMIIEQLTHQSVEEVFHQRIFAPLGMNGTSFPPLASSLIPNPHPRGYLYGTNVDSMNALLNAFAGREQDAQVKVAPGALPQDATDWNPSSYWTAGSAISTLHDLRIWAKALATGHSTNDGGLVIDLSPMKAISIDPLRRTARIEPGLTWGEVAQVLQPYGLALTSGDTASVGVGGLILGGGIGWMVRKHGLTIDSLRAVELVTADGRLLRASCDEHADLFWGLRGGGGNFGVATAFEVELHPAGIVLGGAVFYEAAEAERILQGYARYAAKAPDALSTQALLILAPPLPFIPAEQQGMPCVAILVCYTGDLAEGERIVAPLRALGTLIADGIAPMPYPAIFALGEVGTIRGFEHRACSVFLPTLSDEVLHTLAECALSATIACVES